MDENTFRDPGEVPVLDWIDADLIDIEDAYQRELDEARVERILDWFSWRSFGAIVVARAEDRFHCIDGQHRLEAAKRHPKVSMVPAVIIDADGTVQEAEAFVTVNLDRRNISALDRYWAELAAEVPEALTVAQVCERAEIIILRYPVVKGAAKPRETMAVSAIRSLIDKRGAMRARQMLEVLAKANLAPIQAHQIKAAEALMTDPEFADQVEPEALTDAIRDRAPHLDAEAERFAATHRVPKWKGLAACWFKVSRKKRKAA